MDYVAFSGLETALELQFRQSCHLVCVPHEHSFGILLKVQSDQFAGHVAAAARIPPKLFILKKKIPSGF